MEVSVKPFTESKTSDTCYISGNIFNLLDLSEKVRYNLRLGQSTSRVKIKPIDQSLENPEDKRNIIYLGSSIFNSFFNSYDLSNLEDINLNIWKKENNIYLGPVLGIFVKPKSLMARKNKKAPSVHLEAAIAKNFLCYLFSIDSVDWLNTRVKGLTFVPRLNKWTIIWLPMPNVVYDRRSGLTNEQKIKAKIIRKKFKNDFKIKYINNINYFSKWKPYKELRKYNSVAKYLPHTVRYKNFNDIISMIKEYGFIFLKYYYGSKGKQVMFIENLEDDNYKISYYAKKLQKIEINSSEDLKKYVEDFVGNKKFIIQQGVRLLRYEGRPFDLRVLVLKDNKGQWQALNNYARVARKGDHNITSPSLGSDRIFYQDIYPYLSDLISEAIPDSKDIEDIAIQIASYIDKELGPFGELGIDLATDIYGKIWVLEINTTPRKLKKLDNQYFDIPPKFTAIFDYAKYLCGVSNFIQ